MSILRREEEALLNLPVHRPRKNADPAKLVSRIIEGMHGAVDLLEERGLTIEEVWVKLFTSDDERIRLAAITAHANLGLKIAQIMPPEEEGAQVLDEPEMSAEEWEQKFSPEKE